MLFWVVGCSLTFAGATVFVVLRVIFPGTEGNAEKQMAVSGANIPLQLWELWGSSSYEAGFLKHQLKKIYMFKVFSTVPHRNSTDFHPPTPGYQGPAAGTQRFGSKDLATTQGGGILKQIFGVSSLNMSC